jgi:hypothetical protein
MSSSTDETSCGEVFFFGLLVVAYIFFGDGCGGSDKGSFFKKECSYCSATGMRDCNYCYGEGENDCSRCYGDGKERCSDCSGSGQKYTYDYGFHVSSGTYKHFYGYFPCKDCDQTGKVECSHYDCEDGKVECSHYDCEEGKVKCSYCDGTGYR